MKRYILVLALFRGGECYHCFYIIGAFTGRASETEYVDGH